MKIQGLKLLPLFTVLVLLFILPLYFPRYLFAKSGCCSGHSGVNCSAGAQANGNVICNDGWRGSSCSYSGMVMCQGYIPITPQPTATPIPLQIKTSSPIPTPKPTETPTPSPETQGLSTEAPVSPTIQPTQRPTPTPKPLTTGETIVALGTLAAIIGLPIWIIIRIIKRFRKPKTQV